MPSSNLPLKVALTGATGHLGGAILRELHKGNFAIRALVRDDRNLPFDQIPVECFKGNLENKHVLNDFMASCDILIHSAALISIDGDQGGVVHQTNVEGTRNIMEAARANGIKRVIHISSIHAFDQKPIDIMLDENRQKVSGEAFAYDRSKKEGQEIALSFASGEMDVLVIHPSSIIGPYDYKPSKAGTMLLNLHSGRLPFVIQGGFDFCDSRDVAAGVVNAITLGQSGHSYLLCGKWHSLSEVAAYLSLASGKKINVASLPLFLGWLGLPFIRGLARLTKQDPLYTNEALVAVSDGNRKISSAKAEKELNYTRRPLEETIRDTYQWFRENGYFG